VIPGPKVARKQFDGLAPPLSPRFYKSERELSNLWVNNLR